MAFTRRRSKSQSNEEGDSFWISFSDLMSALVMIFILAVVVLVLQLSEKQQELSGQQDKVQVQQDRFNEQVSTLREAEIVRKDMLEEMQKTLKDRGIDVLITENNSVLSIPSEKLGFAAASYDIDDEFKGVALSIGSVISESIQTDDRMQFLDTVFVEGHTDNVVFKGLEGTGNWGLSTFRAISLWSLWDEELSPTLNLGKLENQSSQLLFSVSGYGQSRPVASQQDNDANRAANRRIDIRFTIVRPDADDLLDISKNLDKAGQ